MTDRKLYMRGWSFAARMVEAGFSEAECNAACIRALDHMDHDVAMGFCAGVLSGYHEVDVRERLKGRLGCAG